VNRPIILYVHTRPKVGGIKQRCTSDVSLSVCQTGWWVWFVWEYESDYVRELRL